MALAFTQPITATARDDEDELMLDIDMEVDEGPLMEEDTLEEGEEPEPLPSTITTDQTGIIPAIYNEDPAQESQPDKVHIRGLDDFSEDDIRGFSQEYFPTEEPPRIQWIDDTSANLIYPSKDVALQALLAFNANPISAQDLSGAPLELRPAKRCSSRPAAHLVVRIAVAGDRKKKGARHESRYYLFHPEADPGEYKRRRFDAQEHRRRRDVDRDGDSTNNFSASMYDDAPTADAPTQAAGVGRDLFARIGGQRTRLRRRSASPGRSVNSDEINISDSDDDRTTRRRTDRRKNGYRDRTVTTPPPPYSRIDPNPLPKDNIGKELFASSEPHPRTRSPSKRKEGTLHSDKLDLFPSQTSSTTTTKPLTRTDRASQRNEGNLRAAARLKADLLASSNGANTQPNPTSPSRSRHQRSNAMDAKTEQDLSNYARQSLSIDSTKNANVGKELFFNSTVNDRMNDEDNGLSIKGVSSATDQGWSIKGSGGFSIKGRAREEVKELFPDRYNDNNRSVSNSATGSGRVTGNPGNGTGTGGGGRRNQGKELFASFDEPIREKRQRARADDWH